MPGTEFGMRRTKMRKAWSLTQNLLYTEVKDT